MKVPWLCDGTPVELQVLVLFLLLVFWTHRKALSGCEVAFPLCSNWELKASFTSVAGRAFAWGMGTNYQLGTGEEDDVWSPVEMTGKQLENRRVLAVSSGGQHTVLLVSDKEQS